MSDDYTYQPSERPDFAGVLPEGDYDFLVTEANEPYRSEKGNLVLGLKLAVGKTKATVFHNVSAGKDKNGQPYDTIAGFLEAISKAPAAGQKADLSRRNIVGSKGRAHIRVKIAEMGKLAGKEINEVRYYLDPAQGKAASSGLAGPDLGNEPDNIPFAPFRA